MDRQDLKNYNLMKWGVAGLGDGIVMYDNGRKVL